MTYRELHTRQSAVVKGSLLIVAVSFALLTSNVFTNNLRAAASPGQDKKLKPEELLARHLEAIGSAEARAAAKSRVVGGALMLTMRVGGAGNVSGNAMMVSASPRLRFGMKFPTIEYPGEDMAFNGERADSGLLPNGNRSRLSAFFSQQQAPLKEGLLGGVLSTAWTLLRVQEQQPRLEYRGLKKVGERELHELSYRPRKGSSDLKILLYFDTETFRHIRTQYSFQIGATIGSRDAPNQNPESYYSLTEEFDDFRAVDGLTLPHKYRLQLSVQSGSGTALYDYNLAVNRVTHNEAINDQLFTLK